MFFVLGALITAVWFCIIVFAVSIAKFKPVQTLLQDKAYSFYGHVLSFFTAGIWGVAPYLVWRYSPQELDVLPVAMIGIGFLLAINKYRSKPRPAIIVTVPYLLLLSWILYESRFEKDFLVVIVAVAAYLGMLAVLLMTGYKSNQAIVAYKIEQDEVLAKLEAARVESDRANQAKSMFLANMSHELRTPLNGIMGLSDVLLTEDLTDGQRNKLSLIKESGVNLLALLNDILDISKIEAESVTLELKKSYLPKAFAAHYAFWKPFADQKNINLVYKKQKDIPACVLSDQLRLRQCLNNLMSNALKFTPDGGQVTVSMTGKEIDGRFAVCFSVRDTGIGIGDEGLAKLFQPFSQAENSTTRKFGGTGLGLMITRKLCRLMGGDASVTSVVGEGSVFKISAMLDIVNEQETIVQETIVKVKASTKNVGKPVSSPVIKKTPIPVLTLPVGTQIPSPQLPPKRAAVSLGEEGRTTSAMFENSNQEIIAKFKGMNCLIVEDNEINLEVMMLLLKPFKLNIVITKNGQEALKALETHGFDFALMDLQMPVLGGIETTMLIRTSAKPYANLPIIATTANALPQDRQNCLDAGMNGYVAKPLNRTRLLEEIVNALAEDGRASTLLQFAD